MIILASDGLGDNVAPGELAQIIPLIVRTPFFEDIGREVADGNEYSTDLHFNADDFSRAGRAEGTCTASAASTASTASTAAPIVGCTATME